VFNDNLQGRFKELVVSHNITTYKTIHWSQ